MLVVAVNIIFRHNWSAFQYYWKYRQISFLFHLLATFYFWCQCSASALSILLIRGKAAAQHLIHFLHLICTEEKKVRKPPLSTENMV